MCSAQNPVDGTAHMFGNKFWRYPWNPSGALGKYPIAFRRDQNPLRSVFCLGLDGSTHARCLGQQPTALFSVVAGLVALALIHSSKCVQGCCCFDTHGTNLVLATSPAAIETFGQKMDPVKAAVVLKQPGSSYCTIPAAIETFGTALWVGGISGSQCQITKIRLHLPWLYRFV